MKRWWIGALALCFAGTNAQAADLSLMTYNVHGLPFPVALGRPAALDDIGSALRRLRAEGRQPHIVAVQEAFTPAAKAIGALAGYRYVAYGPGSDTPPLSDRSARDAAFGAADSAFHGEGVGKHVGSGLAIFSDYPITAIRRMAYPVCAGYDCLANKGALAVTIMVPGIARPVTVVDTHLNSGAASGVSKQRALYAYRRQLDLFEAFVSAVAPRGSPLLVAGDFNVGVSPERRAYFSGRMLASAALSAAIHHCDGCERTETAALDASQRAYKDWLLFRAAPALAIRPVALAAPFGPGIGGAMLSDHIGISTTYRLATMLPLTAR